MTAPTLTQDEVERALAAVSSLALVARALPTAVVREHVLRDRDETAAGAPPRALDALLNVIDACVHLGRAGDELQQALDATRRSAE